MANWNVTRDNIVVSYRNKPYVVSKLHGNASEIISFLKSGDYRNAIILMNAKEMVVNYGRGTLTVEGNDIFYNLRETGERKVVPRKIVSHIKQLRQGGFEYHYLVQFLEKLMLNPTDHVVNEIYDFISVGNMAITPDGYLLAYKRVEYNEEGDLVDCYTRKICNNVGEVVEMNRNLCDPNRNNHCSSGLHFCSRGYLPSYGSGEASQVILVKIDPADVTSIPSDYGYTKGRACKYEVIGHHPYDEQTEVFTKAVMSVGELLQIEHKEYQKVSPKHAREGRQDALEGRRRKLVGRDNLEKKAYTKAYNKVIKEMKEKISKKKVSKKKVKG